jgi:hypothetical protein
MLTASNLAPKDIELVRREIQEIRDALEAFKAGEVTGFQNGRRSWSFSVINDLQRNRAICLLFPDDIPVDRYS